jgi:hypothetical protein
LSDPDFAYWKYLKTKEILKYEELIL